MQNYTGVIRRLAGMLGHIMVPHVCQVCGSTLTASEQVMCLGCDLDMPRLRLHHSQFNIIHRRLGHHAVVHRAAGWYEYRRGSAYSRLLVDAKYADRPDLGLYLGRKCATELDADHFFDGVDALIPMPMHWWKRLQRGYNQARQICEGVSQATGLPVADVLRARAHGVQSRHNRMQRYTAIQNTMRVADATAIAGRHVLVVDDIITTGASLAEAVRAVSAASPASVSVLALGVTQLD